MEEVLLPNALQYIVFSGIRVYCGVQGLRMIIQSSEKSADFLGWRTLQFIDQFEVIKLLAMILWLSG